MRAREPYFFFLFTIFCLHSTEVLADVSLMGTVHGEEVEHVHTLLPTMLDEQDVGRLLEDWPEYEQVLVQWNEGRKNARRDLLRDKLDEAPNVEARSAIRFLLVEALVGRDLKAAEVQFEKLPAHHPGRSHLLYLLATEAIAKGKEPLAKEWLAQIDLHSYRYASAQLKFAELLVATDPAVARDILLKISSSWLHKRQKTHRLLLLSEAFRNLKNKNMARFFMSWAWRELPGHARTKQNRKTARRLGVPGLMERVWDVVWKMKGRSRRKALARLARKWRKKRRRLAVVAYGYGRMYRKTRERERALGRFDRARRLAKTHRLKAQIEIETVLAAHQLGDSDRVLESVEILNELLGRGCRRGCPPPALYVPSKVWQARVDAHIKKKERHKAESFFQEISPWINGHEAHAELLARLGTAAYVDGDMDVAYDRFEELFKKYHDQLSRTRLPWGVRALRWLAHLARTMGHPSRAKTYLQAIKRRWPLLGDSDGSLPVSFLDEADWRLVDSPNPEKTPQMREARYFLYLGRRDLVLKTLNASFDRGMAGPHAVACLAHTALALGRTWRARAVLHRYSGLLGAAGTEARALLGLSFPLYFVQELQEAAAKAGIEPELLAALVRHESNFNPKVRSWAGAIGLAQLLPSTARLMHERLGREGSPPNKRSLRDPALNLELGAAYLAHLLDYYKGDEVRALIAYNAGVGRLKRSYTEVSQLPEEIRLDAMSIMPALGYARRVSAARNIYALLYGRGLGRAPKP